MVSSFQRDLLFESKANVLYLQVALRVINVHKSFACFVRLKCVLFEGCRHTRDSLAHATPCGNVVFICMRDVLFEIVSHFSENENLFVRHQLLRVTIKHSRFDGVLNLALRLLPNVVIDHLEARRQACWHNEREWDRIISRL